MGDKRSNVALVGTDILLTSFEVRLNNYITTLVRKSKVKK